MPGTEGTRHKAMAGRQVLGKGEMTTTADREIVSMRVIDAPRERVWEAYADPKRLALWWGPKGFTNTFQKFDFKPGGYWRFVMRGSNGTDHPNESRFVEIVKPERIILDHLVDPKFRATITLEEQAGKTKLTWRMLFEFAADYDRVKKFAPAANEQNFDRLEVEPAKMSAKGTG